MSKKVITFYDSEKQAHDFSIVTPDYGTCATASDTNEKTITCDDFSLFTGAEITVKFDNAVTTDTITLNVNNSGAKNVDFSACGNKSSDEIKTNGCYGFVYDGTKWIYKGSGAGATLTALDTKVDKVENKGLSTNDYTTEEKQKLSGLPNSIQLSDKLNDCEQRVHQTTKITENSTDQQYPSAAAVWNLVSPVGEDVYNLEYIKLPLYLDEKQNKTTINSNTTSTTAAFALGTNNKETRFTIALTSLAITFPNGEYDIAYTEGLVFDSGLTPTHVSYSSTGIIQWVGTDCFISDDNKSVFKPSANTHYDIVFYYNGGSYIVGLVNGYKTAVGNQEANA